MMKALAMATAMRQGKTRLRDRTWYTWLTRLCKFGFFVVVAWLLIKYARTIAWQEVLTLLQERSFAVLWPAALLAGASYTLYGCFDLLGSYLVGHALRVWQVMAVSVVSYVFNLNVGSLVGGVAFRYRLYSRLKLDNGEITRVVATSMATNWLGYMLLAGVLFWVHPLVLPPTWKIDITQLHLLGIPLAGVVVVYLLLCAFYGGRQFSWRRHHVTLPSLSFGVVQLVLSCGNWLLMGALVWFLLQQKIAYADVLSVLLLAAVAGVITHVPAGLGVIETVFVALLSHQLPANELLAGLLLYRTLYYFIPLVLAALTYLLMELSWRRYAHSQSSGGH